MRLWNAFLALPERRIHCLLGKHRWSEGWVIIENGELKTGKPACRECGKPKSNRGPK